MKDISSRTWKGSITISVLLGISVPIVVDGVICMSEDVKQMQIEYESNIQKVKMYEEYMKECS